ncbi:MAG: PAS domain S-box protein [Candidatus Sulfotelmatobacter sp.]
MSAISLVLCGTYEVLKQAFFPHVSVWQSHVATVLFFTCVMFFLSRTVIRRERHFLAAIEEREEFTNSVIQNLPVLLCIFDADGKFVRWNRQLENKLGYSQTELSNLTILETISEEDQKRVKKTMAATFTQNAAETEALLLHSDGTKTPYYLTGVRIIFQGKPCVLGIAVDISAQRRVQDQLQLQAAALRAAANGIVITNHKGAIEWVNPAFTTMTGFTMKESIGNNPRLFKSGMHGKDFYAGLWSTISSGNVWRGEITNCRKDGSSYTEEMTITPVVSDDGTIAHYIAVKQDISARKRSEEALQRAEEQYRSIFDEAIIGIFRSTPDGRFIMMNPAMAKMLRWDSPEQAIDNIKDIGVLYGDGAERRELQTLVEDKGTLHNYMHKFRRRDGTDLWLSLNLHCIYKEDGTPEYYEGTAEDITLRRQAEEAVEESEKRFRLFVEHAPVGLAMFDREMRYLCASRQWLANYSADRDVRGLSYYELFPTIPERWKEAHRRGLAGEVVREEAEHIVRLDGSAQWIRWEVRPWYEKGNEIGGIVIFSEDVSERRLLETQLQQAQKMEAIGRLAGGVAHDFNNMLGIITGFSELLKEQPNLAKKAVHQIEQIHLAGKKAASLTQQLLAFSRKQIIQPRILDLNEVVSKLSSMLRRLIGDDIELTIHFSCSDALVYVDASQIDQVIMNLAVNARDAMPNGGKLMIETDSCELDDAYAIQHRPVRPGRYVRLTITDTGCGINAETMSHLFEPFYTTKELGKGTGLGLSIVYGIVKQSDGYIWVYSEPGQGTSFKIYLPFHAATVQREEAPAKIENVNGSETVLVVEDDQGFRSMVVGFLKELGYTVLEAGNGEQALEIAASANTPVQALITDIVMPKMGGRDLADKLMSKFPNTKVLYTSGYTHDGVVQTRVLKEGEVFLQKPFALSELSKKLREVIEKEVPMAMRKAATPHS